MNILIILGHPARKRQSLSEALANAYKEGAIESGHEVYLYKVADKQFDPILHEGYGAEQAAEPDIIEAQERPAPQASPIQRSVHSAAHRTCLLR